MRTVARVTVSLICFAVFCFLLQWWLTQDPRTNVLARAPQALWPTAKKSIKARVLPKTERLETSLASLILVATESRAKALKSKPRELNSGGRKLPVSADLSAFIVSSPGKYVESIPQPKTAPLLRSKKNNIDATHSTGAFANSWSRLL